MTARRSATERMVDDAIDSYLKQMRRQHRADGEAGRPLLSPHDPHVIAVATDEPLDTRLPQFALDDAQGIARFVLDFLARREDRARPAAAAD